MAGPQELKIEFSYDPAIPPLSGLKSKESQNIRASMSLLSQHALREKERIFKIVLSLTTGQGQFGHPFLYCLGS